MTNKDKIVRIEKHLKDHPSDYQSVISLYKARSKEVEYEIEKRQQKQLKKIAEYKRKLDGK